MRTLDWYLPRALRQCPACGEQMREWYGIDGPCEDFLWHEGERLPIDTFQDEPWREVEWRAAYAERFGKYRLPPQFTIANSDRLHWITATGRCQDDVWTATESPSVQELTAPSKDLFVQDTLGRTRLFYLAAAGRHAEVERVIFSLAGTGVWPQRLALIGTQDHDGRTAADFAAGQGHDAIAELLRHEQGRMEFFE